MEYLEKFEEVLERENMSGQLRMLLFACAEKVGSDLNCGLLSTIPNKNDITLTLNLRCMFFLYFRPESVLLPYLVQEEPKNCNLS